MSLVELLHHLTEREQQRTGETERPKVRRRELTGRPLAAARAHRQYRVRCVSGENVADADTTVGEQTETVAHLLLDVRRVLRMVRDGEATRLLLIPAERRHGVSAAVQDSGLTRRRRRRQLRAPVHELVSAAAHPSAE